MLPWVKKNLKKLVIFVIGSTVCLIGILLLVLPGPGILTLMLGLAILSVEFLWAKRLFEKSKLVGKEQLKKVQRKANKMLK